MDDLNITDEELKQTEEELKAFEIEYHNQYGRYDINDFKDLIDWARDLNVKDPNNPTQIERLAITIRLLHAEKLGSSVAYKVFRKLYLDLKGDVT